MDEKHRIGLILKQRRISIGLSQVKVAERSSGVFTHKQLSYWEQGKRGIDLDQLSVLSRIIGVTSAELLDDELLKESRQHHWLDIPLCTIQNTFSFSPVLRACGSQEGAPNLSGMAQADDLANFEVIKIGVIPFDPLWCTQKKLVIANLLAIEITGRSMVPTLNVGDYLVLDRSRQEILDGEIFAFVSDGQLNVKRLQRTVTGEILIKSDNPDFSLEKIHGNDLHLLSMVGQAVWAGHFFI